MTVTGYTGRSGSATSSSIRYRDRFSPSPAPALSKAVIVAIPARPVVTITALAAARRSARRLATISPRPAQMLEAPFKATAQSPAIP